MLQTCNKGTHGFTKCSPDLEVGAGTTGANPTTGAADNCGGPTSDQGNHTKPPQKPQAGVLIFGSRELGWRQLGFRKNGNARVMNYKMEH